MINLWAVYDISDCYPIPIPTAHKSSQFWFRSRFWNWNSSQNIPSWLLHLFSISRLGESIQENSRVCLENPSHGSSSSIQIPTSDFGNPVTSQITVTWFNRKTDYFLSLGLVNQSRRILESVLKIPPMDLPQASRFQLQILEVLWLHKSL